MDTVSLEEAGGAPAQRALLGSRTPRSPGYRRAAAVPVGGADLQGVPGPRRGHRLCALRPPGLCRVRTSPAAVPHLQGPHPQPRAHLPALGQVSGHRATHRRSPAWPDVGTSHAGLRDVRTGLDRDPQHTLSPTISTRGLAGVGGGRREHLYFFQLPGPGRCC